MTQLVGLGVADTNNAEVEVEVEVEVKMEGHLEPHLCHLSPPLHRVDHQLLYRLVPQTQGLRFSGKI